MKRLALLCAVVISACAVGLMLQPPAPRPCARPIGLAGAFVFSTSLARGGTELVMACPGSLRECNVVTGSEQTLAADALQSPSLSVSTDGALIAVASGDRVQVFSLRKGAFQAEFDQSALGVLSVSFVPRSHLLAVGAIAQFTHPGGGNNVSLWNVDSRRRLWRTYLPWAPEVEATPNGAWVVCGCGGTVYQFDVRSGDAATLRLHIGGIQWLSVAPGSLAVAVAGISGRCCVVPLPLGPIRASWTESGFPAAPTYSNDGRLIATARYGGHRIDFRDAATGATAFECPVEEDTIYTLTFSRNDETVYATDRRGRVIAVDVGCARSSERRRPTPGHGRGPSAAAAPTALQGWASAMIRGRSIVAVNGVARPAAVIRPLCAGAPLGCGSLLFRRLAPGDTSISAVPFFSPSAERCVRRYLPVGKRPRILAPGSLGGGCPNDASCDLCALAAYGDLAYGFGVAAGFLSPGPNAEMPSLNAARCSFKCGTDCNANVQT